MAFRIGKRKRLIVCLTGMPGAGKSTVATSLKKKGFAVVTMGDVIREEALRQNMEPTDFNLGNLMLKLRREFGPAAVAHLILRKIQDKDKDSQTDYDNLVIDGIRSMPEVEILETIGVVRLLAIHASSNKRFTYITERTRSDAPTSRGEFMTRDRRELSVGISETIALADETLSNNRLTIEELKQKACEIIQKWIDEINKDDDDKRVAAKNMNHY